MKERPILFSAPMVRALLDGSKTQTRRVVKLPIEYDGRWAGKWKIVHKLVTQAVETFNNLRGKALGTDAVICPYGQPGDRLWVRESYRFLTDFDANSPAEVGELCLAAGYNKPWAPIQFDADGSRRDWMAVSTPTGAVQAITPGKGRPSIHMPRWASRILLEIVSVRVERLKDCSEADARAEGIKCRQVRSGDTRMGGQMVYGTGNENDWCSTAKQAYGELWESINGAGRWDANPWVWVVEFKRVTP